MQTCSSHEVPSQDMIEDEYYNEKSDIIRNLMGDFSTNQDNLHDMTHDFTGLEKIAGMFKANVSPNEIKKQLEILMNQTYRTSYCMVTDTRKTKSRLNEKKTQQVPNRREPVVNPMQNTLTKLKRFTTVESYESSLPVTPEHLKSSVVEECIPVTTPPVKSTFRPENSDSKDKRVHFESDSPGHQIHCTPVQDYERRNPKFFSPVKGSGSKITDNFRYLKEGHSESIPFEGTLMDLIANLEEKKLNVTQETCRYQPEYRSISWITILWVLIFLL